ncbi:hypothetical protein GX48_00933, partial [Paracoccidioides brasiliensis]
AARPQADTAIGGPLSLSLEVGHWNKRTEPTCVCCEITGSTGSTAGRQVEGPNVWFVDSREKRT